MGEGEAGGSCALEIREIARRLNVRIKQSITTNTIFIDP